MVACGSEANKYDGNKYTYYAKLLFTDGTLEEVNSALEAAKDAAFALGVSREIDPFMTLNFMSLPVIPTLRLTTRGVIDVDKQQYV